MNARLSKTGFDKACDFVLSKARRLDAALLSHHLHGGEVDAVIREVSRYQNADGGFGNALEPDLRTPASTGIATVVGLRSLREVQAPSSNAVVARAIQHLVDTIDPQTRVWPIIDEDVDLDALLTEGGEAPEMRPDHAHYASENDFDCEHRFQRFDGRPAAESATDRRLVRELDIALPGFDPWHPEGLELIGVAAEAVARIDVVEQPESRSGPAASIHLHD